MERKELLIKGGTVVADGVSRKADVLVAEGKIVADRKSVV